MSEYNKTCVYCNSEIRMSDNSGKWLPFNLDNTLHDCRRAQQEVVAPAQQQLLTIEERVKRLEKVVLGL